MSETAARLVRMANQIATELVNQQQERGIAAAAEHMRLFWDPRMRERIAAHLAAGGDGLNDAARAAIALLGVPQRAA